MNRKYEIGFIVNPEASEEDVKKVVDSVVDIITTAGGTVEKIDEWGRRKFAYPIEKHNEGIYVFIHTEVVGSAFKDIERRLKLNEKVMRFVVLRLDERLKKANRLTKKWKRSEKLSRRNQDERSDSSSDSNRTKEARNEE